MEAIPISTVTPITCGVGHLRGKWPSWVLVWLTKAKSTTCHLSSCEEMVLHSLVDSGWLRFVFYGSPLHTVVNKRLDKVLQQFEEVFRNRAALKPVLLNLKENSQPKFVPACSVAFAIKGTVTGRNPAEGCLVIGPIQ